MSKSNKPGGSARKWVLGAIVGLLVLLAGAYVAAYFIAGNQIPAKAEVEGVAIGGLSAAQAEEKLRAELEPKYAAPIAVTGPDDVVVELPPLENGFRLDYEGAIRDAGGGFSWNPADILNVFNGGGPVELRKLVDTEVLDKSLQAHADKFMTEGKDATLAYVDGEIARTDSVNATALDAAATSEDVAEAFESRDLEVEATLTETPPKITTEMVDEAVATVAAPAISGPVTIKAGEGSFEITPAQIAEVTTLAFDENGAFSHSFDTDRLLELTQDARAEALDLTEAKDASYKMSGGAIVVVPAVDGQSVAPEAIVAAFEETFLKEGDQRVAEVEVVKQAADFTTEEAQAVVPKEVIGEFTTNYPHADYRNTNLGRAAASVNGTVVLPDEVFSLNDTLGPRTAQNGYTDGYVINGGVLVRESGGGISQAATTLYNAGFFAGLEDVEHKPHSLYFSRYPAGREATIYYGSIDMRFRNDSGKPIYLQGYINESAPGKRGAITFKVWGTRVWDRVVSTELVRSDYYNGEKRTVTAPDCEPQAPIQGFTVTWSRLFYKGDAVAKKEDYKWKYSAGDEIICA
ncbi:VanW family protein [Tessaracoccus sp. OS52]|uniref:VanW family protein n=1 Tax=Tessaracoccus sp. OS52 TaxID=2886691 RepID=UPI001D10FB5C|nr:VanW family protein [Tessaracoccus sp. OS52]MCC2593516.1 VanW family protein [Tessaracoccus sp. OS52]